MTDAASVHDVGNAGAGPAADTDGATGASGLRERLQHLITSCRFKGAIIALIVINAITLGLLTWPKAVAVAGGPMEAFESVVLGVFVFEIAAKLYVWRWRFFRSGWNVFDFLIVAISLMPTAGAFSVLRALRILRVFRLFSLVPALRNVVSAFLSALPGMGAVCGVLMLIFYVSAVMATRLFGAYETGWFESVGASMFTLFQIMTLDGWGHETVRPVMAEYPWAWAFFIPFIVVASFAVLNLFIGIIVEALQRRQEEERNERRAQARAETEQAIDRLRIENEALRDENARLLEALVTRPAAEVRPSRP